MKNCGRGYGPTLEMTDGSGGIDDRDQLWRPREPLVSRFLEAKNAYENGTKEIRNILVRECNLIYECNTCRNMFRSLTHLYAHKRSYCCTTFNHPSETNRNGFQSANAVSTDENGQNKVVVKTEKNVEANGIKEYKRKASANGTTADCDEYGNNHLTAPEIAVAREESEQAPCGDLSMEDEGKIDRGENVCDMCDQSFDTEKSLKIHIHKKHLSSSYAFQCPSCSLTFIPPPAVVRQMNERKKFLRCKQVNVNGDVIPKKECPVESLMVNKTTSPDALTRSDSSTCCHCGRSFQRRAVLFSHQANCQLKNSMKSVVRGFSIGEKSDQKLAFKSDSTPSDSDDGSNLSDEKVLVASDTSSFSLALDKSSTSEGGGEKMLREPITAWTMNCSSSSSPKDSVLCSQKSKQQALKSKCLSCVCKICSKHFNALSNLRRHISMFHYRTRKFGCTLCDYRAYRKYDVINHLGHVHKIKADKNSVPLDYVAVHEKEGLKEDVDDDVLLIDSETSDLRANDKGNHSADAVCEMPDSVAASVKVPRKARSQETSTIAGNLRSSVQREVPKFKRSISQPSLIKDEDSFVHPKRSKRNCMTPVNKDFVYDLSNIIKKECIETEGGGGGPSGKKPPPCAVELSNNGHAAGKVKRFRGFRPLCTYPIEVIKGSAYNAAISSVRQGRAAHATLPEHPTERPQIRMRHQFMHRPDVAAVPVIDTMGIKETTGAFVRLLDDDYLENITQKSSEKFIMKPAMALSESTMNLLLRKVDRTQQQKAGATKTDDNTLPKDVSSTNMADRPPKARNVSAMIVLSKGPKISDDSTEVSTSPPSPPPPPPSTPPPPPPPPQNYCSEENRSRHTESLLRLALEN